MSGHIYIYSVTGGWNVWPLIHRNMVKHMIYIYMKYAEKKSHQWISFCQVIKDAGDTWECRIFLGRKVRQKPDGECCFLIQLEQNSPFLGINIWHHMTNKYEWNNPKKNGGHCAVPVTFFSAFEAKVFVLRGTFASPTRILQAFHLEIEESLKNRSQYGQYVLILRQSNMATGNQI